MKIRFSKTLAAVLAATTVTAISGISALAAEVATTTEYEWNNKGNANATVKVTSVVKDSTVAETTQVTYLVSTGSGEDISIKYIDQKPLTGGEASFEFTAKQADIYGGTVTAKFGSDAGIAMPTFTFKDGVDKFTNGTVDCTVAQDETNKNLFVGQLSGGNVTEYGVKITIDGTPYEFPAMGTLDGAFAIEITGVDVSDCAFEAYTK